MKKFDIPKNELIKHIRLLESEKEYDSQSSLYRAICSTQWIKDMPFFVTPVVIASRVREFKIKLKTPKAKHGSNPFYRTCRKF